jgi:hypothetical protein
MLAEICAVRTSGMPVLRYVDLFAGRKGADAKAGERIVP